MVEPTNNADPAGVLLVDDEENILRSLKRLLIHEDFSVFTASSGEQGLEVLQSCKHIGLIISDQRMPGMTGAEFLFRSRDLAPHALRIVLTGYADMETTIDAINRGGAFRYFSKPWNDEDFLQNVRDALRTYSLAQENRALTATVQRQNQELSEWNSRLKTRVLQQTGQLRKNNQELYRKNRNLKITQKQIIEAFSGLIELYSKSLRNHTQNVVNLSLQVAKDMGLPGEEQTEIHTAALLHDIGKIGTPTALAKKPRQEMNEVEFKEFLQHAVRGQSIIDAVEELRPVGVIIRHHHEHFDGRGFPDGCAGKEIPLGSRIIAMADHVDDCRLLNKTLKANEEAVASLEQKLGTLFDPELFPYFAAATPALYQPDETQHTLVERVVRTSDLQEGMILAKDLHSGTGILLLSKGTILDENRISSIRRFQKQDPGEKTVRVLIEEQ